MLLCVERPVRPHASSARRVLFISNSMLFCSKLWRGRHVDAGTFVVSTGLCSRCAVPTPTAVFYFCGLVIVFFAISVLGIGIGSRRYGARPSGSASASKAVTLAVAGRMRRFIPMNVIGRAPSVSLPSSGLLPSARQAARSAARSRPISSTEADFSPPSSGGFRAIRVVAAAVSR